MAHHKGNLGINFNDVQINYFRFRSPSKDLIVGNTNYAMFNDLGIYGTPNPVKRKEHYNATTAMRAMEKLILHILQ